MWGSLDAVLVAIAVVFGFCVVKNLLCYCCLCVKTMPHEGCCTNYVATTSIYNKFNGENFLYNLFLFLVLFLYPCFHVLMSFNCVRSHRKDRRSYGNRRQRNFVQAGNPKVKLQNYWLAIRWRYCRPHSAGK